MDRKDFVLATLLQSTQADIDDYKQWIGVLPELMTHHMRSPRI
jgi:hypothetical protein